MIHSIGYLGPYDPNFGRLALNSPQYLNYDNTMGNIDQPSDKVNGVFFGYLQKPDLEFFAVRAQYLDVSVYRVDNPILIDPSRHTDGKKFGPTPSQFGDESAANLLRDLITANPSQAAELKKIGMKTGLL